MLATAAENCRAAGDAHHAQRPAAGEARLTPTPVHKELLLLPADLAPRVSIRVDRAAAIRDRGPQRLAQRLVQPPRGLAAQRAGDAVGPQPSTMQRLVRVDVSDAGDRALVEQHRLHRGAPLAQAPVELAGDELAADRPPPPPPPP